jgi:hypothetical protein
MSYNFQTRNNKIKLLTNHGRVILKVLFRNAVLAALVSRGKYGNIPQNGDCSRERHCHCSALKRNRKIKHFTE